MKFSIFKYICCFFCNKINKEDSSELITKHVEREIDPRTQAKKIVAKVFENVDHSIKNGTADYNLVVDNMVESTLTEMARSIINIVFQNVKFELEYQNMNVSH